MAILASLFAALLVTSLGAALALLGSAASTLTLHDAQASAAVYAAQAGLSLASAELRARRDWSGAFGAGVPADVCAETGSFVDASAFARAPWDGSTLDLHALTAQLQAAADAAAPPGVAAPVWRLFDYGPISRLVPSEPRRHPVYIVVWAAQGRDGLLLLHGSAFGAGSTRASAETSIRPADGASAAVRLVTRTVP